MNLIHRNILFVLLLAVLGLVAFPSLAQDGAPVIVPTGTTVVEVIPMWAYLGWIVALVSFLFLIGFLMEKAREGNQAAKLALLFFDSARDMLPLEKWQQQFEENAPFTPNPLDDIAAPISGDILRRLNELELKMSSPALAQLASDVYKDVPPK
jgi:hypothetical protein